MATRYGFLDYNTWASEVLQRVVLNPDLDAARGYSILHVKALVDFLLLLWSHQSQGLIQTEVLTSSMELLFKLLSQTQRTSRSRAMESVVNTLLTGLSVIGGDRRLFTNKKDLVNALWDHVLAGESLDFFIAGKGSKDWS